MKQITSELRQQAADKFISVAEMLQSEGMKDRDILYYFGQYKKEKVTQYYKQSSLMNFDNLFNLLREKEADSKAEKIFYDLLKKHNIPFEFQVKIGIYRVDYLICDNLIFEGDGPYHKNRKEFDEKRDKYLKNLGYKIMRMSWVLIAQLQDELIKIIKEAVK